jgi:hypothetical protein
VATLYKAWAGSRSLVGVRIPPVAWLLSFITVVYHQQSICPEIVKQLHFNNIVKKSLYS